MSSSSNQQQQQSTKDKSNGGPICSRCKLDGHTARSKKCPLLKLTYDVVKAGMQKYGGIRQSAEYVKSRQEAVESEEDDNIEEEIQREREADKAAHNIQLLNTSPDKGKNPIHVDQQIIEEVLVPVVRINSPQFTTQQHQQSTDLTTETNRESNTQPSNNSNVGEKLFLGLTSTVSSTKSSKAIAVGSTDNQQQHQQKIQTETERQLEKITNNIVQSNWENLLEEVTNKSYSVDEMAKAVLSELDKKFEQSKHQLQNHYKEIDEGKTRSILIRGQHHRCGSRSGFHSRQGFSVRFSDPYDNSIRHHQYDRQHSYYSTRASPTCRLQSPPPAPPTRRYNHPQSSIKRNYEDMRDVQCTRSSLSALAPKKV